jgi:hypothetical protein
MCNSNESKVSSIAAALAIALMLAASTASAEVARRDGSPSDDASSADAAFPALLRPGVAVATGVPYVAITDLTLGLGPHAALGVLAGLTPRVAGFGLHPRFAIDVAADWRAIARLPVLYYPETNDAEEWALTRPSLVIERRLGPQALRLYAGGGVLWASCLDELFGGGHAHFPEAGHPATDESPMTVLFWTANAGAALPLTRRLDAFVDLATVMDGLALAGPQWTDFGGPPLITVLGVAARL